jgi:hypothetical protein
MSGLKTTITFVRRVERYGIPSLQALTVVCRHVENLPVRTRSSRVLSVEYAALRESDEIIHG